VAAEVEKSQFRQPRIDWILAAVTGIVALVVYALTVQRTVSFWDCGEFIACSVILGVPHPPGTPLLILVGRLFSLLPTAADISLRVNLVSVTSGALAVAVTYLVGARLLRRWLLVGMEFAGREIVIAVGAFCGATLLGFAATVWSNAVEAEVYGLTLAIFMTIIYCGLMWVDHRYDRMGTRLLIFITYLAVFGLGAALMVYLAVPALWLMVMLYHEGYRKDWRIWAAALAMMAVVATGTEAFLWNLAYLTGLGLWWLLAPDRRKRALSGFASLLWAVILYFLFWATFPLTVFSKIGWGTFDWIVTIAILLAATIGGFVAPNEDPVRARQRWGLLTGLMAISLFAFTLQLYIPIRSDQDPRIDENNPETWEAFKGFLERKQYGQESMVTRMFHRRGLWENQFGRHPRMGFWGFFEEQYSLHRNAFLILFFIGLLPFVVPFLNNRLGQDGKHSAWFPDRYAPHLYLFLTLLATTVGLVVYMNFADGVFYDPNNVDQAYLEVRDRDYFFTTGFALYGLSIGLGTAWLIALAASKSKKSMAMPIVGVLSAGALIVLPYGTAKANWFRNDRSRNFIPYEYANNVLSTCPQNTILFTNGDNDTFPVWCLQEAYGIRKDIRVVNLSLVNTDWYILQMKHQYGVPMELTDSQITTRPVVLPDGRIYGKPLQPFPDRFRGYRHELVPYMDPEGTLIRVQDQMVEQIIWANQWKDPVYFSGMYSGETEIDVGHHLEAVGLGYKFVRRSGTGMVDTAASRVLFDSVYNYRSFGDTTSYQDESAASLLWTYPEKILQLAGDYLQANDTATAIRLGEKAREVLPAYWRTYQFLGHLYSLTGRPQDSAAVLDAGISTLRYLRRVNPQNVLYVQSQAFILESAGRSGEALDMLTRAFNERPKEELIFLTLARFALNVGDAERIQAAALKWLDSHPNDERARQILTMRATPRPPAAPPPTGTNP